MTFFSSLKKHTKTFIVASSLAMISFNSFAGYTQVSALITESNSDCSSGKYFDDPDYIYNGFSNCRIFVEDGNGDKQYLSDVIAKFNTEPNDEGKFFEVSDKYEGQVVKDDWNPSTFSQGDKTGSWIYNNNVHTYPDIRFWTAKAGNDFRLFWVIEEPNNACIAGNASENDDNLNFSCMNLAISVTNGDWTTPGNKGLSHITFFGGLCTGPECNPIVITQVPEPTALLLFALGLIGLGARRKQAVKGKK